MRKHSFSLITAIYLDPYELLNRLAANRTLI